MLLLPREKTLPEVAPETKWEKFAREKGIEKKKRGRMVWDDVEQKWAPRFGFKRAYDENDVPIVEMKANDDPNADPWEQRAAEKRERVAVNAGKRAKNEERGGGAAAAAAVIARIRQQAAQGAS